MTRKKWVAYSGVSVIVFVTILTLHSRAHPGYKPPPVAFSGDSSAARQTVVVPTLDTPMPKGKNVIWCGTIQLCWDGLKALPGIQLPNDTDAARRITAAKMNQADLPPNEHYTNAGWIKDGIVQKIQTDMAAKFPKVKPDLGPPNPDTVAMAYAYLAAQVKFTTPYFDRKKGDDFTDSAGNKTHVSSFGMFHDDSAPINKTLAEQVRTLYCKTSHEIYNYPREFALDLDKNSAPSQLILACVEPKESLAATWETLKKNMTDTAELADTAGEKHQFDQLDTLVVPNVVFKIQHRFEDLEKGNVLRAFQSVDFRLDKSGAVVGSEAHILYKGMSMFYTFTRPFLIVMRKRGATEPYFVMWVDNAEMLCKQSK